MTLAAGEFVLPRPGAAPNPTKPPIQGPTEAAFTSAFGHLLPPAKYVTTAEGKAAYYEIRPSSPGTSASVPDRVLLIHGVQTPALGMLPLARLLQRCFPHAHFVLLDLWGHGLSDTPLVPHDASLFHRLISSLLGHLQWPSAHLVGFSFGGSLAAGYTASHPSRVSSLALVAPAGLIHLADMKANERRHFQPDCDDEAAARTWVLEFLEGGELVVPEDWKDRVGKGEVVAEAVREWQMREHPGHTASVVAIVRDGGALDNDAQFAEASRTGIPSLVVLGGLDGVCTREQLEHVGFTNIAVVPDIGHAVVRERASEVAGFIGDFWETQH